MLEECTDEDWRAFNRCHWFLKLVYLFKCVLNYIPFMSQHFRYTRYKKRGKLNLFHFRSSWHFKFVPEDTKVHWYTPVSVCGARARACVCVCVCVY
jgi:hypothetical protein